MPVPWGIIANEAGSLIDNLFNIGQDKKNRQHQTDINTQNINANKELAVTQYQQDLTQWERENAYNDPSAQMARLKEAGLNPNLVYGSGTQTASAASPKAPQVKSNAQASPRQARITGHHQDYQLRAAQIDQTKAATENIRARTETEGFNAILKDWLGQGKAIDVNVSDKYQADQASENLQKTKNQNADILQQTINRLGQDEQRKLKQAVDQYTKNYIEKHDRLPPKNEVLKYGLEILKKLVPDYQNLEILDIFK